MKKWFVLLSALAACMFINSVEAGPRPAKVVSPSGDAASLTVLVLVHHPDGTTTRGEGIVLTLERTTPRPPIGYYEVTDGNGFAYFGVVPGTYLLTPIPAPGLTPRSGPILIDLPAGSARSIRLSYDATE